MMANLGERIIVLIDMDCFFCQVESRLAPNLQGKPVAVVQYNQWKSGGIIAVNYEARDYGVTRHMRGNEAKEKCSEINLVSVPSLRGKADTSKYRAAGREVIDVLKHHCSIIERASVDEAYLDITELVDKRIASQPLSKVNLINCLTNTFVVGYCEDESNDEEQRRDGVERWIEESYAELGDEHARKLAIAGIIVEELRAEIYAVTKFRCSAGISFNKILAKLACGLHKPNRQTILPTSAVPTLFSTLPVKKVRNLGGKFGNIVMESLGCNVMADLTRYSLHDLQKRFDEKTGSWLYNIARGIDNEPVVTRLVCKSIGASKNFPGKQAIVKLEVLKHWINELSLDVSDRLEQDLEENQRRATTLTVSFQYYEDRKMISQSRSCPLKSYKSERIAAQCLELITKSTQKPIANIGIASGKFIAAKGSGNFVNFFKNTGTLLKTESMKIPASTKEVDNVTIVKTENPVKSEITNSNDDEDDECTNDDHSNLSIAEKVTMEKSKTTLDTFIAKQGGKTCDTDTNSNEPISPNTAILGSAQFKKALNRENMKNSFFMNFLKQAKPEVNDESLEITSSSFAEEKKIVDNSVQNNIEQTDDNDRKDDAESNEKNGDNDLFAQLQEIFPDLDNIDRSVVQILPIELQRLANSYLKNQSNRKLQAAKNTGKVTKLKVGKSKGKVGTTNSLQNFFVKTRPNDRDEPGYRQCAECHRTIKIEKYSEHEDFHVAQNLQREMNRNETSTMSTKRRLSDESPTPDGKKAKGITSFFDT